MLTKEQRLRRATIAVVAPLHNEARAEAFEERAAAVEHWRGLDIEDDDAPSTEPEIDI